MLDLLFSLLYCSPIDAANAAGRWEVQALAVLVLLLAAIPATAVLATKMDGRLS